ncbi:MAG: division/cell wall cluster transcriptional repressor MraZ [Kiritimatiellia bacterium]
MSQKDAIENAGLAAGGFVSRFLHSLDPKKRLTIPAEWREQIGPLKRLYILPGLSGDKCLYVYPAVEMARRLEKFRQMGIADRRARTLARVLAASSELLEWDSQGRIRVKDELLQKAEIVEQAEMVGAFDHFEIWNPAAWRTASSVEDATIEDALRYVDF